MRVCFYTLGCKVNLNETGALEQMFRSNGFTIVQEGEPADVFVVNSCTVTNFGDQKSRKWLRRAKRENPGAVTVLTGCYPQAFPEEAAQFLEADLVCGNGDRKAILDNVLKLLDGHERIVAITPHQRGEQFEELPVERFETHTRAFIKVEDGCNRQCAYCVIPRARGPVRSRAESSILAELSQLQGGSNVSGGQKQRLCIARALLKKPKILILDDSTSAVDTRTDAQIRKALREYIPETTKIIIAQRISSVQDADRILVMDGGTICNIGTHEELLKTSEIYREVYTSQNKGGDSDEK